MQPPLAEAGTTTSWSDAAADCRLALLLLRGSSSSQFLLVRDGRRKHCLNRFRKCEVANRLPICKRDVFAPWSQRRPEVHSPFGPECDERDGQHRAVTNE